jgi:hypothetical protein
MKVVPLRLQPGADLRRAVVRTTAELDPATGYAELQISPQAPD